MKLLLHDATHEMPSEASLCNTVELPCKETAGWATIYVAMVLLLYQDARAPRE